MTYYFIDDFDNICRQKDGMDKDFAEVIDLIELINDTNKIQEENEQLKQSNKDAWNLIRFIYNEIKEDGYMDWGRIQDLVEF